MKTFSQIIEEWSKKYKESIDCDNPKGFSQKAHCFGRKKRLKEQFKDYKSLEDIAKKHKVDISFIENQLKMGKKVEKEHTKSSLLATKIALQHLEEIPDYYSRLKKVESNKKIKEECECEAVEELEDRLKNLNNTSYKSIDRLMRGIMKKHDITAKQLHNAFVNKNKKTPDEWIKNKITEEYEKIQSMGMIYSILLKWRGKNILSQIFYSNLKRPTKKEIEFEIRKIYPNCILISFMPSPKNPSLPLLYFNGSR